MTNISDNLRGSNSIMVLFFFAYSISSCSIHENFDEFAELFPEEESIYFMNERSEQLHVIDIISEEYVAISDPLAFFPKRRPYLAIDGSTFLTFDRDTIRGSTNKVFLEVMKSRNNEGWLLEFSNSLDPRFDFEPFRAELFDSPPIDDQKFGKIRVFPWIKVYDNLDSGSQLKELHWNDNLGIVRLVYDSLTWERVTIQTKS